jgi:F420-non-reducing hydrogenase large subunit
MSVDKAAKALIHGGNVNEGLLNKIEMAFRAYDPCNACATHAQGSAVGLTLRLHNSAGEIIREISW